MKSRVVTGGDRGLDLEKDDTMDILKTVTTGTLEVMADHGAVLKTVIDAIGTTMSGEEAALVHIREGQGAHLQNWLVGLVDLRIVLGQN